jgi:hydroxypyruvate reductase
MKTGSLLRSDAAGIWAAALRAVEPEVAVRKFVRVRANALLVQGRRYDLGRFENIWVVGAGKAAGPMARAVERILGKALKGGILVTKYGHGLPLKKLELLEAGHPLPDANSLAAGERVAEFARTVVGPRDLVICLLSGGGSSLLLAPAPGLDWRDKLRCTELMLKSGAGIHETNAVRKHLSALKGGGLARLLASIPVISLILSDVVGDALDTIASGPLAPDPTTFEECLDIMQRFGIVDLIPPPVLRRLREGAAARIAETPKPGDPIFRKNLDVIVGNNTRACSAAAREARRLGYHTIVLTSRNTGDTGESARFHMSIVQEIVLEGRPLRRPACLISGGGRNQEFVLRCVRQLAHLPAACLVASLGTDGTDGPTDAAGAVADNTSLMRSIRYGSRFLDECLRNNDSYRFFRRLSDLIVTGPTRTNVMDLHVILVK